MKQRYELMLVVSPDAKLSDEKKQKEVVQNVIKEQKDLTITSVTSLGKKHLAYPIKKNSEALYLLADMEGSSLHIGKIQTQIRTMEDVLRFMVVKKDEASKQTKKRIKTTKKKET